MMLYLLKLLLSGAIVYSTYSFTISEPESSGIQTDKHAEIKDFDFDFDSVSFDEEEEDYLFMNEYLDTAAIDRMCRVVNPAEIMVILNHLGVPSVLQEPLFL